MSGYCRSYPVESRFGVAVTAVLSFFAIIFPDRYGSGSKALCKRIDCAIWILMVHKRSGGQRIRLGALEENVNRET